jgi:hypothetical protein
MIDIWGVGFALLSQRHNLRQLQMMHPMERKKKEKKKTKTVIHSKILSCSDVKHNDAPKYYVSLL